MLQLRGATPPFDGLVGQIELGAGRGRVRVGRRARRAGRDRRRQDRRPRYRYIPALRGEEFTSMLSVPIVTPLGHLVGVLNVHTRAAPRVHRRRRGAAPVGGRPGRRGDRERPAAPQAGRARGGPGERSPSGSSSGRSRRAAAWPGRSTTGSASGSSACSSTCPPPPTRSPADPAVAAEQVARAQELAAGGPGRDPVGDRRAAPAGPGRPGPGGEPGEPGPLVPRAGRPGRGRRPAGWPSTWRRPCTGPRRRRCRTWPSTPTPSRSGSGCTGTRDRVVLEVSDDGAGFDPRRPTAPAGEPGGGVHADRASACPACGSGRNCSAARWSCPAPRAAAPRSGWLCRSLAPGLAFRGQATS